MEMLRYRWDNPDSWDHKRYQRAVDRTAMVYFWILSVIFAIAGTKVEFNPNVPYLVLFLGQLFYGSIIFYFWLFAFWSVRNIGLVWNLAKDFVNWMRGY